MDKATRSYLRRYGFSLCFLLVGRSVQAAGEPSGAVVQPSDTSMPAYCAGDYADDFTALSSRAQATEREQAPYTFCVRTTATYACPFYGPDGELQRSTKTAIAHGTAFAYQGQGKETLLLTNQHVSDWPIVTDERHTVEDVPPGCKRISASLSIVDNESDSFEADDLPLSLVVSDPQLDVAVLKAHATLPVMPWSVGRSAGLRTRNIVQVRGFPLGIFKAMNVGKVISAYDRDTYGDWDHDDFVIDALLSAGNSGSPVLAISCKTGAFELVGIFHAGYSSGSALNVVIGIDQIHDLMTTFKRKPRAPTDSLSDGDFDAQLVEGEIRRQLTGGFLFPFGSQIAGAWIRTDGALIFDVLSPGFPLETYPIFAAESLPGAEPQSAFSRVWFGKMAGLQPYVVSEFDAKTQAQLAKIGRALRLDSYLAAHYRAANGSVTTREESEGASRLRKSLETALSSQREVVRMLSDLGDRLGPASGAATVSLAAVLQTSAPPISSPGPTTGVVPAGAAATIGAATTAAATTSATIPKVTAGGPRSVSSVAGGAAGPPSLAIPVGTARAVSPGKVAPEGP